MLNFCFRTNLSLLIFALFTSITGYSQHSFQGAETQVNTTTADKQHSPCVARNANGAFVVVWSSIGADGDGAGVYAQMYNPDGTTNGSEFLVNQTTEDNQTAPSVDIDLNGNFAVVWMSYGQDFDGWGIYGRIYNSSGVAQTNEFLINNTVVGDQKFPKIGMSNGGDFAVVWSNATTGDIYLQRFQDSGSTLGNETKVNTDSINHQAYPDMEMDNNGDFVVTWQSLNQDGSNHGIYFQRYDGVGSPRDAETLVNTVTSNNQQEPSIGVGTTAAFVIAWASYGQDGSEDGIYAQRYDNTGVAQDSEFKVNTTTTGMQAHPDVAMSSDGAFVITWSSYGQDGSFHGVYLQAYNSEGLAVESEMQINTNTNGFQLFSDVAMHDDTQDAVFVWQDGMRNTTGTNDGDDYGIFMQRVLLDIGDIPVAVCQDITAYLDGSGNVTVPATDVDGGSTSNVTITSYELSDSTFTCSDIGNNTETLTVTNSDNNSDNCTAIITVADSTAPAAVCGNITAYIYSAGSVTISTADIDGGTSDNCQANLSLSKSTFTCSEIGANTLTMYATDPSGNTDSCATVLTVLDTVSPTITCVNDISANVNAGQCIATVSYGTITGDDNCSSTGVTTMLTSGLGSGGNFPIGVSTEVWTATDSSGNIQSCSFTITVTDNVAPTAVCQDLTVFLDGIGSATISENDINNGSSDDCSSVSVSIDINSFSCLETGANNVVLTATDVSTNSANCTATVTVSDTTFPVASCPADTSLDTDAGVCGAVLNYSATGTDNCGSPTISLSSGIGSGGTFTPGITTETYNIADASGNQVSCSFTVTVTDIEAPIIVCPDNITVSNDVGMCDAVVTYGPPGGVDNCPGETISMTSGLGSGSTFPVGISTESYTMTDSAGNQASCSFTITVNETELPTITCPVDTIVAADPSTCATTVTYSAPVGSDNCTGQSTTQTAGLGSGATFSYGVTTETYTVTDASGNTAQCSFNITVLDTEIPVITCPADTTANNTADACSTNITYTAPAASDNCTGLNVLLTSGLGSGGAFPVGATTVTYQATDTAGNQAACSFTVTIIDNEAPGIICPADITIGNDAGVCGAAVSYAAPDGTDNFAVASTSLVSGLGSGATFPIGTTTEKYLVTDTSGNQDSCSFTITILDNEVPTIICPNNVTVSTDAGLCSAVVSYSAPGTADNCPGEVASQTAGLGSGATFNLGVSTESFLVTDASGNTAACSFTITVNDTENPAISCPTDTALSTEAGLCTATFSYSTPVGSDNCAGLQTSQTAGLGSGAAFPVGTTTETYLAIDTAGNQVSCSFNVTVNDNEPPVPTCPADITVSTGTGACEAIVTYTAPTVADNCPGASISQSAGMGSGATYGVGMFTETYQAVDASGNQAACSFTITVNDNELPSITCPADTSVVVSGGSSCAETITYTAPVGTDNCAGVTTVQTAGLGSGANFIVGATVETYAATDASGNEASCSFTVSVLDTVAPVISACPPDAFGCSPVVGWSPPAATDNCSLVSITSDPVSGTMLSVGSHNVLITASDFSGNTDTCSFTVTVYSLPTADAGADVTICGDASTTIGGSPTGQGGSGLSYTYMWSNPGLTLDDPNAANPVATPTANTTYSVFVIDNTSGCASTDNINVAIEPYSTTGVQVLTHQEVSIDSGDVSQPTQLSSLLNKLDDFGKSAASLGNLSGKGEVDVAVGAARHDGVEKFAGEVFILSLNSDGEVVTGGVVQVAASLTDGIIKRDYFGSAVAAGDLNNDGIPDLAVGARRDELDGGKGDAGTVRLLHLDSSLNVVSDITIGDLQLQAHGITLEKADEFGASVSIADIDGDGNNDLIVGAPLRSGGGVQDGGSVFVLFMDGSGGINNAVEITDGSQLPAGLLYIRDHLGYSVATADINLDGTPDIIAGAERDDTDDIDAGAIYTLLMNNDGTVASMNIVTAASDSRDWFGSSVGVLDDIDGDDVPEIMVGSIKADDGHGAAGRVTVLFLNADGTAKDLKNLISDTEGNFKGQLDKGDFFGSAATSLGVDLDGNCIDEVFVGAVSDDYPGGQRDLGTGWVLWLEPGVPTTTKEVTHSEEPAVIPVSRNETLASGQETHIKTPSNNIILYPNPSEGRVELLFKDAIKAEVKVEVVTLLGQVTYTREETLNNEQGLQLELSTLAAGQYLVKVTFGQEQFVKMLNLTK